MPTPYMVVTVEVIDREGGPVVRNELRRNVPIPPEDELRSCGVRDAARDGVNELSNRLLGMLISACEDSK